MRHTEWYDKPSMPKRVFFLTYYFPPLGGVGSIRSAKFAKHLLAMGWEPTVFHAGAGHFYREDATLLDELPSAIRRVPVRTFEGGALFKTLNRMHLGAITYRVLPLFPLDSQIGWVPALIRAVEREVRERGKPHVLFSSAAPNSVNVAGLALQKRLGVPWVADFRDEWTRNPGAHFATPLHARVARRYERETLCRADAVTTVTQTLVEQFQEDRPAALRPVALIRNGFDEEDFAAAAPERFQDKWTLANVGTSYVSNDPAPVFQALAELIRAGRIPGAEVCALHAGGGKVTWPEKAPFEVRELGFVPHRKAVELMRRAHVLTLVINRGGAAGSRIYEHVRSGTPILCMAPDGEAWRILEETGGGACFYPGDADGIKAQLLALFAAWREGRVTGASQQKAQAYSRVDQAARLAAVFESLTRPAPGRS